MNILLSAVQDGFELTIMIILSVCYFNHIWTLPDSVLIRLATLLTIIAFTNDGSITFFTLNRLVAAKITDSVLFHAIEATLVLTHDDLLL